MATTEVILVNDSPSSIFLVHTSECQKDNKKSTYQGKPSYWKTPPPNEGDENAIIKPNSEQSIGSLDSIFYFDSPSWIYFRYAEDATKTYQVYADLRWKGGILAQIGPYKSQSTEDDPMPGGAKLECIEYSFGAGPKKDLPLVRIHIPPRRFWDFPPVDPKKAVAQIDSKSTEQIVMILAGAALSTIITTCFLLPPPGLAAITVAGRVAIGATAVQGVLGLFTSNGSYSKTAGNMALGPADAYRIDRLALDEFKNDSFRTELDDMQRHLRHSADNDDIAHRMTEIAKSVDEIIRESKGKISIQGAVLDKIKLCLKVVDGIVDRDGSFQKALRPCLDKTLSKETDLPSQSRMSLALAGLTMTLNAYTLGYTLRSFLALDTDTQSESSKLAKELIQYSAEAVIAYMPDQLESFPHSDRLLAYRMSFVNFESPPVASATASWLQDSGIENCTWAAWNHDEANTWFRDWHWYPQGEFHDGQPVTWSTVCSETVNPPSWSELHQPAKRHDFIWSAYVRKMEELIAADIDKVWHQPAAAIMDAFVAFKAQRVMPVMPFNPITVYKPLPTSTVSSGQIVKLRYDGVRYGYSYVDSRDSEGDICWSDDVQPLSLTDLSVPTGFELSIPKDPDNARAEATIARALEALKVGNIIVPKLPEPHFTSAYRKVYRKMRLATGANFTEPEALSQMLPNMKGDVLMDQWPEGWVLERGS